MRGIAIAAAAAVVVAVRLFIRWRGRSERTAKGALAERLVALGGETSLVASREIRERVRARAFRVVTVLLLLVVAAAIVIPVATKGKSGPQRVGVTGSLTEAQRATVLAAARSIGTSATVVPEPDQLAAEAALRSGGIDLAVLDGRRVISAKPVAATDTTATARLAYVMAANLGLKDAFAAAQLSPTQVALILGARPLPVSSIEPASSKPGLRGTSVLGVIVVFIMLTQYETWTLIGVMEEKSSRVVEVLLATVRPIQLLGGKVLGIGAVAMVQASAVLAFALVLGRLVGSDLLKGTAPVMLATSLLWLVVGYAFYCWVYAAAGSLAERQDQVQTLALPLSLPMILGYVLALTTASSGHASSFFQVLGYLPPTAPFVMPVLVGLGAVSWFGFVASVVISIVCTVAVARGAATIYRRAVLRTGRRVRLAEVVSRRHVLRRSMRDAT